MWGSTVTAASTEAGSIAVVNSMVTGASTSTPVATVVRNAAWVSGTMSVGSVAVVGVGRTAPIAPRPMTAPSVMATPTRATTKRRSSEPA